MCVAGGGVRAGGAVGLHGRGAQRGLAAGRPARRAAQGRLRRLVVRAARRYVAMAHSILSSRLTNYDFLI